MVVTHAPTKITSYEADQIRDLVRWDQWSPARIARLYNTNTPTVMMFLNLRYREADAHDENPLPLAEAIRHAVKILDLHFDDRNYLRAALMCDPPWKIAVKYTYREELGLTLSPGVVRALKHALDWTRDYNADLVTQEMFAVSQMMIAATPGSGVYTSLFERLATLTGYRDRPPKAKPPTRPWYPYPRKPASTP